MYAISLCVRIDKPERSMRNTSDDFNKKKYLVLYGVAIIMADIEILIKKYNKTPTGKMTRKRPDLNWC